MKKIILTVFMGLFLVTSSFSQESSKWIGGTLLVSDLSDHSEDSYESSRITLIPEFGYRLNGKWSIGGRAGFTKDKRDISVGMRQENSIHIIPFARYEFANLGKFKVFGQGELPISFIEMDFSDDGYTDQNYNSVGLNVRPGLSYSFNENWGFQVLMPTILRFENRSNDYSVFKFGINDGYNIQEYLLETFIGFRYQF